MNLKRSASHATPFCMGLIQLDSQSASIGASLGEQVYPCAPLLEMKGHGQPLQAGLEGKC